MGALGCFAAAAASDAIDGPLIRLIGRPSVAGAYFDATADCVVIVSAFAAFAWIGIYPAWTAALIGIVFLVFIVTSRFTPNIYDPVGRHIGGLLFLCAGATLLLPDFFFQAVLLSIAVAALATTLTARLIHTFRFVVVRTAVIEQPEHRSDAIDIRIKDDLIPSDETPIAIPRY